MSRLAIKNIGTIFTGDLNKPLIEGPVSILVEDGEIKAIDRGDKVILGVNAFKTEAQAQPELLRVNPQVVASQVQRLRRFKAQRDPNTVTEILTRLAKVATGTDNLMPVILRAVETGATLGEISDALRNVWGEYKGEAA